MGWTLVDPRYYAEQLRRNGAALGDGATPLWYQDDTLTGAGELVLWMDRQRRVVGFELSHTGWPHGKEHVAEWSPATGLRMGEVESGDAPAGLRRDASSLVRRLHAPNPAILRDMLRYFDSHSGLLDPAHRQAISGVLHEAASSATP